MSSERLARDTNFVTVLGGVTDDVNQFIKMFRVDPVTGRLLISISGGTLAELTATGAVNGNNAAFTFTQKPTYIVSDGAWYKPLDNNGGTQWSWNAGTLTATMVMPPTSSIFGVQ